MTVFEIVANRTYGNKHVLTKLIEHHAGIPYKNIVLHYEDELNTSQLESIISDYRKYEKEKMPLEYIVGHVDFLGNSFHIDHRAMIPRPETEYMIQAVVEGIQNPKFKIQNDTTVEVLDLGCGCGVLGLSVGLLTGKRYIKSIQSRDISPQAVDLTKQNIEQYRETLEGIELGTCVSNGLVELGNQQVMLEKRKTSPLVVVCNYPYIPDDTFDQNADECAKTREPRSAFVGGKDGLDLYRVLFGEVERFGLTHGVLYLEMMTWQMESLIAEFGEKMDLQIIKTFHFNIIIVKATWKKSP